MLRRLVILGVLLQLPMIATGRAVVLGGMNVADRISVDGEVLQLNGAGLRSVPILGIGIYVAALYLPYPSHDPAAILAMPGPKAIVLHFLHAASKAQVEGQMRKGERINCGEGQCNSADLPDFERLVAASPAVSVGDTSTYVYEPHRLRVLANGNVIGDYPDGDLSAELLKGFIGAHPPTEELKRQLLGVQ